MDSVDKLSLAMAPKSSNIKIFLISNVADIFFNMHIILVCSFDAENEQVSFCCVFSDVTVNKGLRDDVNV
jgi:hypothetical protein